MLMSSKLAVLGLALALGAGAASAQEAGAQDAGATTAPSLTADQIDQWIRAAPPPSVKDEGVKGVTPGKDRKVHGMVSVSVGTGGYSNVAMASAIPLGETGLLTVGVSQTQGGRSYGGYGYGRGRGFGYGGLGGPGYGYGGDRQSFSLGLALGGAGESRSRPCVAPDYDSPDVARIYRPEDGLSAYDPIGCAAPRARD